MLVSLCQYRFTPHLGPALRLEPYGVHARYSGAKDEPCVSRLLRLTASLANRLRCVRAGTPVPGSLCPPFGSVWSRPGVFVRSPPAHVLASLPPTSREPIFHPTALAPPAILSRQRHDTFPRISFQDNSQHRSNEARQLAIPRLPRWGIQFLGSVESRFRPTPADTDTTETRTAGPFPMVYTSLLCRGSWMVKRGGYPKSKAHRYEASCNTNRPTTVTNSRCLATSNLYAPIITFRG